MAVAIALFFLGRRLWRFLRAGQEPGCGYGCTGCAGCPGGIDPNHKQGPFPMHKP
ncbi:FeoB-associated Cys-rich membrane protein [Desulfobulbus propionicus]